MTFEIKILSCMFKRSSIRTFRHIIHLVKSNSFQDVVISSMMQYLLWCGFFYDAVSSVMRFLLWCGFFCDAVLSMMKNDFLHYFRILWQNNQSNSTIFQGNLDYNEIKHESSIICDKKIRQIRPFLRKFEWQWR